MTLHEERVTLELKKGVMLVNPFDELSFKPFPDPKGRAMVYGTRFNRECLGKG